MPAERDELDYLEGMLGFDFDAKLPPLKDFLIIDSVFVPTAQRGHGIGTRLLLGQCRKADMDRKWLIAHAYPWEAYEDAPPFEVQNYAQVSDWRYDEFSKRRERLIRFYERAGFVHAGDGWCYRCPTKIR